MAGAGILCVAHAGLHHTQEAQRAGDWLLAHPFDQYNATIPGQSSDRYHYGLFTCCQAMYQFGGKYWEQFYPPAVEAVLANQQPMVPGRPISSYTTVRLAMPTRPR